MCEANTLSCMKTQCIVYQAVYSCWRQRSDGNSICAKIASASSSCLVFISHPPRPSIQCVKRTHCHAWTLSWKFTEQLIHAEDKQHVITCHFKIQFSVCRGSLCYCLPPRDENTCPVCGGGACSAESAASVRWCCTPGLLAWSSNQRTCWRGKRSACRWGWFQMRCSRRPQSDPVWWREPHPRSPQWRCWPKRQKPTVPYYSMRCQCVLFIQWFFPVITRISR